MTLRLDRYAPKWALAIVEDLDTGDTGREAVQRAAEHLRNQATEADAARRRVRRSAPRRAGP